MSRGLLKVSEFGHMERGLQGKGKEKEDPNSGGGGADPSEASRLRQWLLTGQLCPQWTFDGVLRHFWLSRLQDIPASGRWRPAMPSHVLRCMGPSPHDKALPAQSVSRGKGEKPWVRARTAARGSPQVPKSGGRTAGQVPWARRSGGAEGSPLHLVTGPHSALRFKVLAFPANRLIPK